MPFITKDNAKELSRLALLAKQANPPLRTSYNGNGHQNGQSLHDPYSNRRLSRTRKQIDLLDNRIEEEIAKTDCDGQRVDRLASALARLSEIERQLANRPLPGSLKPTAERRQPRPYTVEPREAPQPIAVPPQQPSAPAADVAQVPGSQPTPQQPN